MENFRYKSSTKVRYFESPTPEEMSKTAYNEWTNFHAVSTILWKVLTENVQFKFPDKKRYFDSSRPK